MSLATATPSHSVPVYGADMFPVVSGANLGDGLSFAEELQLEDTYALGQDAAPMRLSICSGDGNHFTIAGNTATGQPGATVVLDSCLTLMTRASEVVEMLVLIEVDKDGAVAEVYSLPLAPLDPRAGYLLVGIGRDAAQACLAQLACVSFTRGTHITLATGEQRPIEDLQVGDKVLTRDDGPQEIRWIGQNTARAVGEFAPIVITAGALYNTGDLVVSPDNRLVIYQRSDELNAGRSELLVKARHLANGNTIYARQGGFVDFFQLLFDRHQIIFAEGIAAETLLADQRTHAALPRELVQSLRIDDRNHSDLSHLEFDVSSQLPDRPDAAELLRRASTR
ncbi:Hint domain-containing protein [Alisedimentitalea sp. MJ-SS2]|uniref:Hint domain-containing protein n=1 Tax=Aliisedimentitalea sp. MJ-SS2 TaxID=3049795 RepID=UPI0029065F11|nr:Hint domain-containing protein [Alisedimentitalea sp. MJ-SS2]MDU8929061.1 Hint domain-containing protein [Alisedimentitalea sp. MJ-SS2]